MSSLRREMTLKRAKVDSQSLTNLANRFVGLKFDLEDADVETALELKLLEKKRLLIPEEDQMFRFSNFGFMQEEQEGTFKRGVGEVDVRFYRPLPRE